MAENEAPIDPTTLGSMRRNGVRGLFVTCVACGYDTAINVDAFPDEVPVPSFGPADAVHQVRQAWCDRATELDRACGQIAR